jgi:hypothetical protein
LIKFFRKKEKDKYCLYVSRMFPIFFEYKAADEQYHYLEDNIEYCMTLLLMLKFKRYFRETGHNEEYPLKSWMTTLSPKDLNGVTVCEKNEF